MGLGVVLGVVYRDRLLVNIIPGRPLLDDCCLSKEDSEAASHDVAMNTAMIGGSQNSPWLK